MIPCWAEGSGFRLTQTPDGRQKRLDDLYEYGKKKGTLTYKEIMERLMDLYIEPDQLDKVLENLEALGVTVINENDPQPAQSSEGVEVYLDDSLRRFETVFPACGSSNSAIDTISKFTCAICSRLGAFSFGNSMR